MNIIIIGAQASGKMTIGQEIAKQTGMTLFHNHDSIDFVLRFMPWSPDSIALTESIRFKFFETFAKTGQKMIFTIVIDFNDSRDVVFLEKIQTVFQSHNQEVLFVELETELSERLKRNRTDNRLKHKPSNAIFNPEVAPEALTYYHKINNTCLTATETAYLIIQKINQIKEKN